MKNRRAALRRVHGHDPVGATCRRRVELQRLQSRSRFRRALFGFGVCAALSASACSDDEPPPLTPEEEACLRYCAPLDRAARELDCERATPASCFGDCIADAAECSLERLRSLAECVEALPQTAFACLGAGDPAIVSSACDEQGVLYEDSCSGGHGGSGGLGAGGEAGQAGSNGAGTAGGAGAGGAAGSGGSTGGEGGSGGEGTAACAGEVAPCFSLGTAELCGATLGCQNSNGCSGSADACESFNGAGPCESQLGCAWDGACSGMPGACSSLANESACLAQTGCIWGFACSGSATPCAEISIGGCELQPGCAER